MAGTMRSRTCLRSLYPVRTALLSARRFQPFPLLMRWGQLNVRCWACVKTDAIWLYWCLSGAALPFAPSPLPP